MTMIAAVALIICIVLIVRKVEPRLVLFVGGMVMCLMVLNPMAGFNALSKSIAGAKVIETIAGSMAFAFVMQYTKCDQHMVHMLSRFLTKAGPIFLIPGGILVTAFVHVSVPSAAGCAASVGPVLIPILIGAGVAPVMAASILFCGTYGATMLNPGFHQIAVVSEATGNAPAEIVANHFTVVLVASAVVLIVETAVAFYLKEHKGYVPADAEVKEGDEFKVNFLYAITPLLPLTLILLGAMNIVPALKALRIIHCMIIGVIALCVVTRTNPAKISVAYWEGFGKGITNIYSIIICSAVFVAGIRVTGLLKVMIDAMSSNPSIARIAGSIGPFLLAVICGSGDAASVAFNQAVTPFAAQFGMNPMDLGGLAAFTGCLGRTMSPVAGCTMVCCGLAGTKDPVALAKRNAPAMVAAMLVTTAMLMMR